MKINQYAKKTCKNISLFFFQKVLREQAGNYTCLASNLEGDAECNTVLLKILCEFCHYDGGDDDDDDADHHYEDGEDITFTTTVIIIVTVTISTIIMVD